MRPSARSHTAGRALTFTFAFRSSMLRAVSLLLAAVCVVIHAAPHQTPEASRDALKDPIAGTPSTLLSDSFGNTSPISTRGDSLLKDGTQTSAPDEPSAGSTHERNEDERQRNSTTPHAGSDASDPPPPAADPQRTDTLQLVTHSTGAAEEDRGPRAHSHSLTTDPTGQTRADSPGGSAGGPAAVSDSWTEADRLRTEEVSSLPSFQELGTEATMSSEDLPLIFEPFEDVTPPASQLSVAMVPAGVTVGDTELEQMVSMATERTSTDVRASGMLDRQTSGAERTQSDSVTRSSITYQTLTVVHLSASRPKTDAEGLESNEEPDEDEEDEEMDSDEEEEEESEEDLTESTLTPHTRPPYSLIPPPPVWVQRNQGLVRSWVELIREKAGYVSGMLAPVGIGIAGALLLVGALYSIRLIHRKRRDSFKHQRRKPPREVRSGPDNAMLLADSSEDEF